MNARHPVLVASLTAVWLNACTPTRVADQVNLAVPSRWHHAASVRPAVDQTSLAEWWKGFGDSVLNSLITRALATNHDLRIAVARVREARALSVVAESALYPSIDLSASGGREKRIDRVLPVPGDRGVELITPVADAITGGLSVRWEIDVFGGNRLKAEAASSQALGTEEGLRAVQVGLLAQVAMNYLELRGAQKQTAILQENIQIQRERLQLLQAFFHAGLATELDIERQQALLSTTEGTLPVLKNATTALIHRLGVLLGETPASLETRLGPANPLPPALPKIPGLMPSDLLAQRPDLRGAQTAVTAAAASLGAVRADLFPKFMLSASGGFGALALGGLPSLAEGVYTLGAGLTAPLFNAGRIRAQIAAADARLDQTAANYEKTFLTALEEVENAFVAHTSAGERRDRLARAREAARRAERLTGEFYQRGLTDFLSVLDAQRSRLASEDELARAETAVALSMVSLYRAFGGGWSV